MNRMNWSARDEGREQQRKLVRSILNTSKVKLSRPALARNRVRIDADTVTVYR
jgi:hypothetical protein